MCVGVRGYINSQACTLLLLQMALIRFVTAGAPSGLFDEPPAAAVR